MILDDKTLILSTNLLCALNDPVSRYIICHKTDQWFRFVTPRVTIGGAESTKSSKQNTNTCKLEHHRRGDSKMEHTM